MNKYYWTETDIISLNPNAKPNLTDITDYVNDSRVMKEEEAKELISNRIRYHQMADS